MKSSRSWKHFLVVAVLVLVGLPVLAFFLSREVGAEAPVNGLRISEVHPRPAFDVNGDGRSDANDAFVELSAGSTLATGLVRLVTGRGELFWQGEVSPAHPAVIFSEIFSGYSGWVILQVWEEPDLGEVLDERGWEFCSKAGSWETSCGSWHLVAIGSPGILAECRVEPEDTPTLVRITPDGWVEVANRAGDQTGNWIKLDGWSVTAPLSRKFFWSNPVGPGTSVNVKVRAFPSVVRLWDPFGELVQEVRVNWDGQPGEFWEFFFSSDGHWSWSEAPVPSQPFSVTIPLVFN